MKWPKLQYVPIDYIQNRLWARGLRKSRKDMIRFFLDKGFFDLAVRLRVLQKNSRLDRFQKCSQFENILQAYANEVAIRRAAEKPTAETASSSAVAGCVGVPSTGG